MVWDCETALVQSSFKNDMYMPLNQIWSLNLIITRGRRALAHKPLRQLN